MKMPMLPIIASIAAPVAQVAAQWLLNQFPPSPKGEGDHGMGTEIRPSLSGALEFLPVDDKLYAMNKLSGAAMVTFQKEQSSDGTCVTTAANIEIPRGKAARVDSLIGDYSQIGHMGVIQANSPLSADVGDPKMQMYKAFSKLVGFLVVIGAGAEFDRGTRPDGTSFFRIRATNALENFHATFRDSTGQTTEINANFRSHEVKTNEVKGQHEYLIPVEPWVAQDVLNDFSLTLTGPALSIRSLITQTELVDVKDLPEPYRTRLMAELPHSA